MVRNTYTRKTQENTTYQHRSSMYAHRSRQFVHATANDTRFDLNVSLNPDQEIAVADQTEQYVLPPKQPTPDVVLRGDFMPTQRSRVAL